MSITRIELLAKIRQRLKLNGTDDAVVDLVCRPGFFTSGDAGLIELARKLGVIEVAETLEL